MIAWVLVALIAGLQLYILVLEMVLWETPRARAAFGTTAEFAAASKVLAGNQGLYNGFLGVGLLLGLWLGIGAGGRTLVIYLLVCVAVAGLYGAMSVGRKILFIQTMPAALALAAVMLSY